MLISCDSETALIRPGLLAPPLTCVSLAWRTSAGEIDASLLDRRQGLEAVRALLAAPDVRLVLHNGPFDLAVFSAEDPSLLPAIFAAYDADRITDTIIRQKLIDIAKGCLGKVVLVKDADGKPRAYSLANLAKRHFHLSLDKTTWRGGYGELRDVPLEQWPDGARRYAMDDAGVTLMLAEHQERDAHLLDDQFRQARAQFALHLSSCHGVITDPAAVDTLERETRERYVAIEAALIAGGLKRQPRVLKSGPRKGETEDGSRDTKAARARIVAAYAALGEPHPVTEKGQPALDSDACEKSGDPLLRAYAEISALMKTLSTDVELLRCGVIQTRYDSLVSTGRTSSSQPNTQNLPRKGRKGSTIDVRGCFVARPGTVFIDADYAGLELRTWSQACVCLLGFSRMAEVLNAPAPNDDPHSFIAAEILECDYLTAYQRAKAKEDAADNARQCGKIVNFSCPGGGGVDTLVHVAYKGYGVEISKPKMKTLVSLWASTWPEARPYLAMIGRLTERSDAVIEQLFSRRFRGGLTYCSAANSFFQGLGADAMKEALWLITKACYVEPSSPLFGCRLCFCVHDEFILEAPEERAHEALLELERLMIVGAGRWLPDVPPKVEGVMMRRWNKSAKRVVADGRVVPWAA